MNSTQQAAGHSRITPKNYGVKTQNGAATPAMKPGMARVVMHGGGMVDIYGSGGGATPIEGKTVALRGFVTLKSGLSYIPRIGLNALKGC